MGKEVQGRWNMVFMLDLVPMAEVFEIFDLVAICFRNRDELVSKVAYFSDLRR